MTIGAFSCTGSLAGACQAACATERTSRLPVCSLYHLLHQQAACRQPAAGGSTERSASRQPCRCLETERTSGHCESSVRHATARPLRPALWVMHVLDESTNIAANLHCLCWSFIWPGVQFHYAFWEICFRNEASPGCAPLATKFWQTILAKVGCTTFFHITVLEILRC